MSKQIDFRVANIDCEHDAGAIERGLKKSLGLTGLRVCPKACGVALTTNRRGALRWHPTEE
jgi:copper chaperone CopZ